MKISKRLIIVIVVVLLITIFLSLKLLAPSELISESQEETLNLFGDPSQFVVTYLPQESDSEGKLARYEVWYYPNQNKRISFLAGKIIDSRDWKPEEGVPASSFKPWDFEFFTSYKDLVGLIGEEELHLFDLPGFNDEGLKTYATEELVLVLEDDYLTYVETFAYEKNKEIPEELKEDATDNGKNEESSNDFEKKERAEDSSDDKNMKTYSSSDIGFSIEYPKGWFLRNGVFSNYDTDYMFDGGTLPEEIFKCDFYNYNGKDLELGDLDEIKGGNVDIYKTEVEEDDGEDDGLGYGDNVVFLFEKDDYEPLILICFFYDGELEEDLLDSIRTFEFLN